MIAQTFLMHMPMTASWYASHVLTCICAIVYKQMHTCYLVHRHVHMCAPHVICNRYVMQCVFWHAYTVVTCSLTTRKHCLASPFDHDGDIAASCELREWSRLCFVWTWQRSQRNFYHKAPHHDCDPKNISKHFGLMTQNVLSIITAFSCVHSLQKIVTDSTTCLPSSCMTTRLHWQNKVIAFFKIWLNGKLYANQLLPSTLLKL